MRADVLWAAKGLLLLTGSLAPAVSSGQTFEREASVVLALAEPLPHAFKVATGDVNGDGQPDIVIGTASGVMLLLAQAGAQFGPGRAIPINCSAPIPEVALADLDRDGFLDLVVYCPTAGVVETHRGQGDGTFQPPQSYQTGSKPLNARGMLVTDLNQDGILDLAIGQDGQVAVLLGNGDATFRPGTELKIGSLYTPARPVALTVADFNGDGIPDLAAANLVYNDDLSVFLGTGGGQFTGETKFHPRGRPYDLVAVDFDRDGNIDLAVACNSGLVLMVGDGHGSFQVGNQLLSSQDQPISVASADLNKDGLPDFVVGNYYAGRISVLLNHGNGCFTAMPAVPSIGDVFAVLIADMNGDSVPDLLATSYSGSSAFLAMGRGKGEFDAPTYFGNYPANSFLMRSADLDGDGQIDLAVILQGRRSIRVLPSSSGQVNTILRDDYPLDGVFADFNGDGIPDLALITVPAWQGGTNGDFNASLRVLPGIGDGTFAPEIVTGIEKCPVHQGYASLSSRFLMLAAGDFDGDGIPDIALLNLPLQELHIYHGRADGTFEITQRLPAGIGGSLLSADFDADGIQDLAVFDGRLNIYLGNASGNMIKSASLDSCPGFPFLAKGDFDGNGKPDLLLNCGFDLTVLLNSGGGLFQAIPSQAPPSRSFGSISAIGDFNGDGKDDLATITFAGNQGQSLAILLNDGNGGFREPLFLPQGLTPVSTTPMDFDHDGTTDLVIVDPADGALKVLLNKPADEVCQSPDRAKSENKR